MAVTNRDIRCRTMDDLLVTLESVVPEEDKVMCLRDMGITNIHKYGEYMANLEKSIKEKEERKKELESIVELEKEKSDIRYAPIELLPGTLLAYVAYKFFEASAMNIVENYKYYGLGAYVGSVITSLIGLGIGIPGAAFLCGAFKDIKNYIKAKYIEHKRGKINVEELKKELNRLGEDLNKERELYSLLKNYYNKIF